MVTSRILIFLAAIALAHADTIELANGNKVEGKVLENNAEAKQLTVEFNLGGTVTKRTVPYASVKAITVNGTRTVLAEQKSTTLTPAEVQALIAKVGPTDPDWFKSTKLNYPKTLDLSWAPPAQGNKWNNQVNVGQFIWDIINPNSSRWREGTKFVGHVLDVNKSDPTIQKRAQNEMANMYFRFFQDYARAAWWWQQAGTTIDDGPAFHLAECYWRLGSKQMALDFMNQTELVYLDAIKLLGDMGETDRAVKMAEYYDDHDAWLLGGDACRLAGRLTEAQAFYEKVVDTPGDGQNPNRLKRTQNRAQANLDAIKLFELADVSKVADGTYKASSLGYEAQVEVSVTVRGKKIEDVKVTKHREKQYYSSITDVPAQIIAKQSVKGVDATSRATITGEAIINATAKALAQGAK
ncbi:FMN-binding protein [Prosthecobacter sp.]|uniref:FMN-binding protein n=1 Tax=Prosthecobacter sp. TaxID=1965333 RepID=UPI001D78B4AB|nr:FMN-binding protein [Prosthecobacter sp.]MCB1278485.1 FMN-binding protein [Prosthecobacter sp.]